MESDPHKLLLYVAHAKRNLKELVAQGKLAPIEFQRINRQLDSLSENGLDELPPLSLQEVLSGLQAYSKQVDLSPLKSSLHKERVANILHLRQVACDAGEKYLNINDFQSSFSQIPIIAFQFDELIQHYQELKLLIREPHPSVDIIIDNCERFFSNQGRVHLAAGFPALSSSVIRRLVAMEIIDSRQAISIDREVHQVQAHLKNARVAINDAFNKREIAADTFYLAGDFAYQLLINELASKNTEIDDVLLSFVINWPWFNKAELLGKLLHSYSNDQDVMELVAASTGLDPKDDPNKWVQWMHRQNRQDKVALSEFQERLLSDKMLYDLFFMLSCRSLLHQSVKEHWWPVLRSYFKKINQETITNSQNIVHTPNDTVETHAEPEVTLSIEAQSPHEAVAVSLVLEDEVEHLESVEANVSKEDRIVDSVSPWSQFLKPFLSENWLGLIGVGSLLVAWLFLSMWLWDKGQFFRIIAGALPLAIFTLASAWFTRFLSTLERNSGSRYAISLTAALCVLSIPFNFLLAASLLELPGMVVKLISIALGVAYIFALPVLARWIRSAFNFVPKHYLYQINGLIYLPFTFAVFYPNFVLYVLSGQLFIVLAVLIGVLKRVQKQASIYQRFSGILFSVCSALSIGILFIYYRISPDPALIGCFFQCVAISLLYYKKAVPRLRIISAGLSVLGLLLSVQHLFGITASMALAAIYWFLMAQHIKPNWPKNILALHIFILSGLVGALLSPPLIATIMLFTVAYVALVAYERWNSTGAIVLLSYVLPVFMLVGALLIFNGLVSSDWLVMALIVGAYTYCYTRCIKWFSVRLWYVNNLLFFCLAYFAIALLLNLDVEYLALYLCVLTLSWALAVLMVKDPLTQSHGSALTWLLCAVAVVTCISQIAYFRLFPGIVDYAAYISITAALVVTTYRTQSSLPVYVLIVFCGALVVYVRSLYGIHSQSGFGSALVAFVCLAGISLINKKGLFKPRREADLFFNKPFYLTQEQYVRQPLQHLFWLLTTISIVQSIRFFTPIVESPKLGLGLVLALVLVAIIALQAQKRSVAYLQLLPFILLSVSFVTSFTLEWQPIVVVLMLLAYEYALLKLEKYSSAIWTISLVPYRRLNKVLHITSVPAGLLAYAVLPLHSTVMQLGYGLLAIGYIHWALVMRSKFKVQHIVITHLALLWSLLFINMAAMSINAPNDVLLTQLLQCLFGMGVLIFISSYLLEISPASLWQNYVDAAQYWLMIISLAYFLVLVTMLVGNLIDDSIAYTFYIGLGVFLFHIGNRWWNHSIPQYGKAILSVLLAYSLVESVLWALFIGLVLFSVTEWLLHKSKKFPALRLQSQLLVKSDVKLRIFNILHIYVFVFIACHFVVFYLSSANDAKLPHYLLYVLIPYGMVLSKTLDKPYMVYFALAVFAYTNIFMSLNLLPLMRSYDLGIIHLINGVLALTIITLVATNRLLIKRLAL